MASLNVFVDPSVSICTITAVRIMSFVKSADGLFCDFVWEVWLGKYSIRKKSRMCPTLVMVLLMMCSVRPLFVARMVVHVDNIRPWNLKPQQPVIQT